MDATPEQVLAAAFGPSELPVIPEEDAGLHLGRGLRIDLHRAGNAISITQATRIGGSESMEPPFTQTLSGIAMPRSTAYQRALEATVAPLACLPGPSRQIVKDIRDKLPDTHSVRLDDYDFRREIKRFYLNSVQDMRLSKKEKWGLQDKSFTRDSFRAFLIVREKEPVGASEKEKADIILRETYRSKTLKYLVMRVRESRRTLHENPLVQLMTSEHRKRSIRKSVWTKRHKQYVDEKKTNPSMPENEYYEHETFDQADKGSRAKRQSMQVVELARELIDVEDLLEAKAKRKRRSKPAIAKPKKVKATPAPQEPPDLDNKHDEVAPSGPLPVNAEESVFPVGDEVSEDSDYNDVFASTPPSTNAADAPDEKTDTSDAFESNTGVPDLTRDGDGTRKKKPVSIKLRDSGMTEVTPEPNSDQADVAKKVTASSSFIRVWISWIHNIHEYAKAYAPSRAMATGLAILLPEKIPNKALDVGIIKTQTELLSNVVCKEPWMNDPRKTLWRLSIAEPFTPAKLETCTILCADMANLVAYICSLITDAKERKSEKDIFSPDAAELDLIYQARHKGKKMGSLQPRQTDIDAVSQTFGFRKTNILLSSDCKLVAHSLLEVYTTQIDTSTAKAGFLQDSNASIMKDVLNAYTVTELALLGFGSYDKHRAQYALLQTYIECVLVRGMLKNHSMISTFLTLCIDEIELNLSPVDVHYEPDLLPAVTGIRAAISAGIHAFFVQKDVVFPTADRSAIDSYVERFNLMTMNEKVKIIKNRSWREDLLGKCTLSDCQNPRFDYSPLKTKSKTRNLENDSIY